MECTLFYGQILDVTAKDVHYVREFLVGISHDSDSDGDGDIVYMCDDFSQPKNPMNISTAIWEWMKWANTVHWTLIQFLWYFCWFFHKIHHLSKYTGNQSILINKKKCGFFSSILNCERSFLIEFLSVKCIHVFFCTGKWNEKDSYYKQNPFLIQSNQAESSRSREKEKMNNEIWMQST